MKRIDQMRLRAGMTVGELAEEMRRAGVIGAGRVGRAVEIVAEMFSDPDYTTFITLSGPLVPSGMRLIFRDLIRDGYVDAVVSNGANLVHDIVEAMGRAHMVGDVDVDDRVLLEKGINRAYDIFIESDTWIALEEYIGGVLDDIPEEGRVGVPIHGLIREIGLRIEDEGSILGTAARKGVPIFSPGFLDSMLGIPLWMYSKRSRLVIDPIKDFDLLGEMVYEAKKSGAIILGGGTPKHHAQYMNTLREGLDAAVQISSARVEDGSLSGAPLKESVSWGKLKGDKASTIFGDVTIVFPLIVAAALERIKG
ncbi:deoxyhypusine synthase [Candidatus Bathyarchaeota archaeon]|nr:deoxyhypusine synthase [Candidatus Bathyarchaeota archaeon]MBL7080520.1 deoxyhypusine synthase [Candidatus Bathyarchaeota archaeon]